MVTYGSIQWYVSPISQGSCCPILRTMSQPESVFKLTGYVLSPFLGGRISCESRCIEHSPIPSNPKNKPFFENACWTVFDLLWVLRFLSRRVGIDMPNKSQIPVCLKIGYWPCWCFKPSSFSSKGHQVKNHVSAAPRKLCWLYVHHTCLYNYIYNIDVPLWCKCKYLAIYVPTISPLNDKGNLKAGAV